ncbi:hypothetical protein NP233_g8249 [Leucocoprinus birnbaumii]|uniref:HNH nuclease domain-containing protein n=1 Tax=Leucocoprinus birnbaumii TaxID=56174 RepID=A0AAD5VMR1_9AGAR|nr:hypothetical protein NP233_g8249 [Leucocoprinus birnbaumii]
MMNIDNTRDSGIVHHVIPDLKERVQAVDPNGGRCLVENCSSTRAIEYCHLVPRSFPQSYLESLEWYWNMRANTLNLDTRCNIFPANASVHHIHDNCRFVLAPEESIVQQYYDTLDPIIRMAWRPRFPIIPDRNNFRYTLIPIKDMEDIAFSRQTLTGAPPIPNDFTTHLYPYDTLPVLISHIHPKYAIVSAGAKLSKLPRDRVHALLQSFPRLLNIMHLYRAWIFPPPANFAEDDSFWPPYDPSDEKDNEDNDEGGKPRGKDHKDTITEKGRCRIQKRPREQSPTGNSPRARAAYRQSDEVDEYEEVEESDCDTVITPKGRYTGGYWRRKQNRRKVVGDRLSASGKRKRSSGLSHVNIGQHTRKVGKMEWNGDALRSWSSQIVPEKQVDLIQDVTALDVEHPDVCGAQVLSKSDAAHLHGGLCASI